MSFIKLPLPNQNPVGEKRNTRFSKLRPSHGFIGHLPMCRNGRDPNSYHFLAVRIRLEFAGAEKPIDDVVFKSLLVNRS